MSIMPEKFLSRSPFWNKRSSLGAKTSEGKTSMFSKISGAFRCCCIFNSITCCILCLTAGTITVVFSLGIYFIIFSISYQMSYDSTEREKRFDRIQAELEHDLLEFSGACLRIEGTQRQFAEWTFGDLESNGAISIERIISVYFPYIEMVVEELGEDLTFGIWTHQTYDEVYGDEEQQIAFFFDYGKYIFTNHTHSLELDIKVKDSYGHDLLYYNWTVVDTMDPLYTESDHAYYMTRHKLYEYWLSGEMPYMSFSIGSGPFDDLGEISDGHFYAGNIWFGQTIRSFSEKLQDITPKGTSSWLVEINLDYLLGVSDFEDGEELFSHNTFISPSEYEKNDHVRDLCDELEGKPELLDEIRSGERTSYTSEGQHYLFRYIDYESYDFHSEWLLVNSKSKWEIHRLTYLTIFISVSSSLLLLLIFCFWICLNFRVIIEVIINVRQMRKIDEMNLEDVHFPLGCCSFFEFTFLRRRLIKTVSKLKSYRRFLPEYIFMENEKESKGFYFRSRSDIISILEEEEDEQKAGDDIDLIFDDIYFDQEKEKEQEREQKEVKISSSDDVDDDESSDVHHDDVNEKISQYMKLQINEGEMIVIQIQFPEIDIKSHQKILKTILSGKRKGVFFDIGFESVRMIILSSSDDMLFFALKIIRGIKVSLLKRLKGTKKEVIITFPIFSVSRGKGYYGNLGNSRMRRFCVGGEVVKKLMKIGRSAERIVKKCIEEGQSIIFWGELTDDTCIDFFKNEFVIKRLKLGLEEQHEEKRIYEVGMRKKKLQKKKEMRRWEEYNHAMEDFYAMSPSLTSMDRIIEVQSSSTTTSSSSSSELEDEDI